MSDTPEVPQAPTPHGASSAHTGSKVVFSQAQTARMRDMLARFAGARRSVTFYPRGHEVVTDNVGGLMQAINAFHREGFDVPIVFFNNEVLLGDQLLTAESVIFDQLIRDMISSGLTSVTFEQGLTAEELERAMQVLALDRAALNEKGGVAEAVRAADLPHVEIGAVAFARDAEEFENEQLIPRSTVVTEALDAIREMSDKVRRGTVPTADQTRSIVKSMVDNVLEDRGAMLEVAGLKDRKEYTFTHSVNVMTLAIALGSMVTDNKRFLNSLGCSALLHDVGLMTEEMDALVKAGKFSKDDWELMKKHPVFGAETAASMRGLDRTAIVVILEHHLRYDLDGYPERSRPEPQHLMSRIVGIVDAYDAMTSDRTYAPARRPDEAMEQIANEAGTAFDPVLSRLFTQMMGYYPPRSVVTLSSGEIGVVTRPTADPLAPHVNVIIDEHGKFIEPAEVDLSDETAAAGRVVAGCVEPAELGIYVDDYMPRP